MSVTLDVVPLVNTLDMYGPPDSTSAYSLDGAVVVRISSSFPLWNRPKPTRILLKSLQLVFEGSAAVLGPSGFSSIRICSIERELITGEPVEIDNNGLQDTKEPCSWNVLYNLPIPGWLPESSFDVALGTRYGIYATAKFIFLDDSNTASFWNMCLPFHSRTKTVRSAKPIVLRRLFSFPSESSVPSRTFLLDASTSAASSGQDFPPDIVSKIHMLISVPQLTSVDASRLLFSLRFRAPSLDEESASRLHVTNIRFKLTQTEQLRYAVSTSYPRYALLPNASQQPPNVPLRNLNAFQDISGLEFLPIPRDDLNASDYRTYSLLPTHETGHYNMGDDGTRIFQDACSSGNSWYNMEFSLPFENRTLCSLKDENFWSAQGHLRPSSHGPLFSVEHALGVSVDCAYDLPDGSQKKATLKFTTELHFANFASKPADGAGASPVESIVSNNHPSLFPPAPYASTLPIYSQLYESNGERKVDYSTPLPLYSLTDSNVAGSSIDDERKPSEATDSDTGPLLS